MNDYYLVKILHLNVVYSRDRNGEDTHQNVIRDTVLSFGKFTGYRYKGSNSEIACYSRTLKWQKSLHSFS